MNEIAISGVADADAIRARILTIRGVQVMLDRDLAELYGVEVGQLNRQVKRNLERFPGDFMFQVSREECSRCQIGTLNGGRGSNIKYLPYAFTENGVAMLSGILRSSRAIAANIQIMRAFNAMRKALASLAPLLARIEATDRRQIAEQAAPRRRRGAVQRAVRRLAHGQGVGQVPRPLPHHRQGDAHPRRCVAEPPRQEVLRVLVARQVQHPGHPGQALSVPAEAG